MYKGLFICWFEDYKVLYDVMSELLIQNFGLMKVLIK